MLSSRLDVAFYMPAARSSRDVRWRTAPITVPTPADGVVNRGHVESLQTPTISPLRVGTGTNVTLRLNATQHYEFKICPNVFTFLQSLQIVAQYWKIENFINVKCRSLKYMLLLVHSEQGLILTFWAPDK